MGNVRRFGRAQRVVVPLTFATPLATDASLGDVFTVTATSSFTLSNPTNAKDGDQIEWRIRQDGTGSRVMTLDTKFRFGTDITAATLTTTANKTDRLGVEYHAADDKFDVVAFIKGH